MFKIISHKMTLADKFSDTETYIHTNFLMNENLYWYLVHVFITLLNLIEKKSLKEN